MNTSTKDFTGLSNRDIHIKYDRELTQWDANSRTPRRILYVKNISDQHLYNIVVWIRARPKQYSDTILRIMVNEMRYRLETGISVPEYNHD